VATRSRRLPGQGWAVYVPAVSGPAGGGAIKLGGGSTTAAVAVALAPYAVYGLLLAAFLLAFVAALVRCIRTGPGGEEAMERLVNLSAAVIVSVLTLTLPPTPTPTRARCPAERSGKDGRAALRAVPGEGGLAGQSDHHGAEA
jgi:hypothetical protein